MKRMKFKSILFLTALVFSLSGCLVFSFYPLYTEENLFPNDLLLGEWIDEDLSVWKFEYPTTKNNEGVIKTDSTSYILKIKDKDDSEFDDEAFEIHLIQLDGHYFLDFYVGDSFDDKDLDFYDFHLLPVHTFAKIEFNTDSTMIRWFDPEWLEDLIEQNKIRIHHEDNGDRILLTAKPKELQKFVTKYANSEDAFDGGIDATLKRIK